VQIGAAAQDAFHLPVYFLLTVAAAASGTTGAAICKPVLKSNGMGKIEKGILGGFSGKVGTVVGGNWRGIDYMRSKGKRSNTAPFAVARVLTSQLRFN